MPRNTKTTQRICWAATRGTPCKDWEGNDLRPVWKVETADGRAVICCDAHLPWVLRECKLPAEVHAAPAPQVVIKPPSYKMHNPGRQDVVGKEEEVTEDLGPQRLPPSSDPDD